MEQRQKLSAFLDKARELVEEGDLEKPETVLKRVMELDPNNVSALVLQGDIYKKKGNLKNAIKMFEKACQIEPKHEWARMKLALAYKELGKKKDAQREFKLLVSSSDYSISSASKWHLEEMKRQPRGKEGLEMEYFEVPVPNGDGFCSDRNCPCPEVRIPRGTGYLYIGQEVVDFRRDARSHEDAVKKMVRAEEELEQQTGAIVMSSPRVAVPVLVCEQGAKLRGLDLEVAAADARYWWKTGKVPLRPTPLAGSKEAQQEKKRLRWQFWK